MIDYCNTFSKKMIAGLAILVLIVCLFASCSHQQNYAPAGYGAQVVQTQPQVIQQAPVMQAPVYVQPSHDGFLTGLVAGSLLGGGGRDRVVEHRTTTIVQQRPPITTTSPAQRYQPAPQVRSNPVVSRTVTSGTRTTVSVGRRR